MGEWRMQEVLKLINLYAKFDCLWNFRSPKYKRQDLRKDAWLKLSSEFGKNIGDIKKKIKCLRSAYVTEKKKVDDSKRFATSVDDIYHPHLYYFQQFKYLDSVIVLRKLVKSDCKTEYTEIDEEAIETASGELNNSVSMEDISLPPTISNPLPSSSPSIASSKQSRTDKIRTTSLTLNQAKNDDAVNGNVNLALVGVQENIYSAFGKTIALQLGQLTPLDATATMSEIHQLLSGKIMRSMLSSQKKSLGFCSKSLRSPLVKLNRLNTRKYER